MANSREKLGTINSGGECENNKEGFMFDLDLGRCVPMTEHEKKNQKVKNEMCQTMTYQSLKEVLND